MVYFTADMHFGHRAIINMQSRPFESVEGHDLGVWLRISHDDAKKQIS